MISKMAPTNKNLKCGACPKRVTNGSGGIMCEGNCKKWFHFNCAGKSKSEYAFSKGEKSNFKCDSCMEQTGLLEHDVSTSPAVVIAVESEGIEDNTCKCFDFIKILTDQISDLTNNQLELRKQLNILQNENAKLTSMVNNHSDAIGDIFTGTSSISYASVLKSAMTKIDSSLVTKDLNNKNNNIFDAVRNVNDKHILTPAVETSLFSQSQSQSKEISVLPTKTLADMKGNLSETKKIEKAKASDKEKTARLHENKAIPSTLRTKSTTDVPSVVASLNREQVVLELEEEPEDSNSGFIEVRKRNSNQTRKVMNNYKRSKFLTGRAPVNDDNLKIVEKHKHIFVSRFAEGVESENIKQYVIARVKGNNNCEVTKLKSRYPGYSSFKVGVPLSQWNTVYDEGVESENIKQYVIARVKGNNNCEVTKLKSRYPGYSSFKVGVPLSQWNTVYDEGVESENIKQYVIARVKGNNNCEVTKLKSRYPGYSSFKVGVPLSQWNTVYDEDFWPEGTYVRRFVYKRKSSGEKGTHEASFLENIQVNSQVT
ncbi:uncharacterized protein LOC124367392 isoform X2 [Homalodisca vitripennis]|uniref:uncharacterized protein LOC124367392 isoform X2 n=1 Tax=Homalodisca vitripennis TaxID=197043 RepID=UPI001EEABD89|nr:uncharacterized protein LOC124367392 isoform X2 [Homalodisca vitripennis]